MYRDMNARLDALEERLGVNFKDRDLLIEAVTHRSYLNENRDRHTHNEVLEFLGDAVLELAVTEYLFKKFHNKETEGTLTNWRAALVNTVQLARVGISLRLDEVILMSRGQAKMVHGSKEWNYVMACTFEAILGALYNDQGFGAVRMLVDATLHSNFSEIIASFEDHKSQILELAQERFGITPHYKVLRQWGPDHKAQFHIAVCLGQIQIGDAQGNSKKEAESAAAKTALQTMNVWERRLGKRGSNPFR